MINFLNIFQQIILQKVGKILILNPHPNGLKVRYGYRSATPYKVMA
jgi:hypothetical protein